MKIVELNPGIKFKVKVFRNIGSFTSGCFIGCAMITEATRHAFPDLGSTGHAVVPKNFWTAILMHDTSKVFFQFLNFTFSFVLPG
jgi:hypothetical protein